MAIKTSGIDHIHFNVKNIKRLREVFAQLFEPEITPIALLEPFSFYNSCVSFPKAEAGAFMDVFQPAGDNSPIAEHLARHGQGVSFVAFRVENLEAAADHAKAIGLIELSRHGYRGMKQVQFDTFDDLGFLLEFVEYEAGFDEQLEDIKARCRRGETVDGLRYVDL